MKKVSVIIPFYSNIPWLKEAVDSVLAQTYKNFEIILVNDGSPEDLSEFLNEYGDKIKYITQRNGGPGSARNHGIREATGDYIAFQDSDDIWLQKKLEMQVAFMETTNTMWSHTGFFYWNPENDTLKEVNSSRDFDDITLQRMVSTQIATPSVMIDAKIYKEGDYFFPEDIRNGEDDKLYTQLARKYKISLVEEPLLKVRLRGSNSNSKAIERFNIRKCNYDRWKKEGVKMPFPVHFIYSFYRIYSSIFGTSSNRIKDLLAKGLWTVPYAMERLYVKYLFRTTPKDEKYILRKNQNQGH